MQRKAPASCSGFRPSIMLSPTLVSLLFACANAHPPGPGLPRDPLPWEAALLAEVRAMKGEISSLKTAMSTQSDIVSWQSRTIKDHSARIKELEAGPGQPDGDKAAMIGRRLQDAPPPGKVVHIHSTSVDIPDGPGWRTSGNYNGGHRRTQQGSTCGPARAQAVQTECCDEPSEDCSGGVPRICNAGCAAIFLPFWNDCAAQLHFQGNPIYEQTVAMCRANTEATDGSGGRSNLVREFQLICSDGSSSCVPQCGPRLHGDLLLLAVNGEDSKYSCELHHGQYSWVGPAAEGGYLGSDALTFVSAVVSGAAGLFMLTLTNSASISTLLTVEPGQIVAVSAIAGNHIGWGTGGFSVLQRGALTLGQLTVNGPMTVAAGATLQLNAVTLLEFACLTAHTGSSVGLNGTQTPPVCSQCNTIEHCHTSKCTSAGVAVCEQCDAGYYAFRHDEAAGRCLANSVTLAQVGFAAGAVHGGAVTASAVGTFHFNFAGGVSPDLASATTVIVPSSASLVLVGSGAEIIMANFSVHGSLSITAMGLRGALSTPHKATAFTLHDCSLAPHVLPSALSLAADIVHISGLRALGSEWTLAQPTAAEFVITLSADLNVGSLVAVGVGQHMSITGQALPGSTLPSWGSGDFEVKQHGALSLTSVGIGGNLVVLAEGNATVIDGSMTGRVDVYGTLAMTSMVTYPLVFSRGNESHVTEDGNSLNASASCHGHTHATGALNCTSNGPPVRPGLLPSTARSVGKRCAAGETTDCINLDECLVHIDGYVYDLSALHKR
jgi:hypothetical protein